MTELNLLERLKKIASKFNEKGVKYVLVGGLALWLHGIRRYTEDIDFVFVGDEDQLELLKKALFELYDDPQIQELTPSDIRYSVIRYGAPDGTVIDIIFRIGEVADFEKLQPYIETKEIDGVPVKVLSREGLIFLKEGSLRPLDQHDTALLKKL